MTNKYNNKLFSVLGDSISTLDGYTEPEGMAYYEGAAKFSADVFFPEDTWWGAVIERLGAKLLVNNSISGSMVIKHQKCELPTYGCSDERTSALDKEGLSPDVIMVLLGTNDWGCGARLVPNGPSQENDLAVFSIAYKAMLEKLTANYPYAEIWCMTLPVGRWSANEFYSFRYCYAGTHIDEYCEIVREMAKSFGCRLIDLYHGDERHDTIDGFHPNKSGMMTLADSVIRMLENDN